MLAVSAKLSDMSLTQTGYGAYLPHYNPKISPLDKRGHDGIHILNIETNQCRHLINLTYIAKYLNLVEHTPLYGFHTKISSDNKYVLVNIYQFQLPITTL